MENLRWAFVSLQELPIAMHLVTGIGSDQQHLPRQRCFPEEKHCWVAAWLHRLLLETLLHCCSWTSCFVAVLWKGKVDEDHGEVVVHFTITQEGLNLERG